MDDHQKRLWGYMIELIESYLNGTSNNFSDLVGALEGALDASEITDTTLINSWYDFWTPLEIQRALNENNLDKKSATKHLTNMLDFLKSQL